MARYSSFEDSHSHVHHRQQRLQPQRPPMMSTSVSTSTAAASGSSRKMATTTTSGEFGRAKTIFVLAVVIGCFAILWPKIFYPMLTASLSGDDGENHMRPERPLRSDMLHPALREKGRGIPPAAASGASDRPRRTLDLEARPGPLPGVRPPVGGAGHVIPSPKGGGGGGAMGLIMPIYTIGIVIFFLYTLLKILFRKTDEQKPPLPEYGVGIDSNYLYQDKPTCCSGTILHPTERERYVTREQVTRSVPPAPAPSQKPSYIPSTSSTTKNGDPSLTTRRRASSGKSRGAEERTRLELEPDPSTTSSEPTTTTTQSRVEEKVYETVRQPPNVIIIETPPTPATPPTSFNTTSKIIHPKFSPTNKQSSSSSTAKVSLDPTEKYFQDYFEEISTGQQQVTEVDDDFEKEFDQLAKDLDRRSVSPSVEIEEILDNEIESKTKEIDTSDLQSETKKALAPAFNLPNENITYDDPLIACDIYLSVETVKSEPVDTDNSLNKLTEPTKTDSNNLTQTVTSNERPQIDSDNLTNLAEISVNAAQLSSNVISSAVEFSAKINTQAEELSANVISSAIETSKNLMKDRAAASSSIDESLEQVEPLVEKKLPEKVDSESVKSEELQSPSFQAQADIENISLPTTSGDNVRKPEKESVEMKQAEISAQVTLHETEIYSPSPTLEEPTEHKEKEPSPQTEDKSNENLMNDNKTCEIPSESKVETEFEISPESKFSIPTKESNENVISSSITTCTLETKPSTDENTMESAEKIEASQTQEESLLQSLDAITNENVTHFVALEKQSPTCESLTSSIGETSFDDITITSAALDNNSSSLISSLTEVTPLLSTNVTLDTTITTTATSDDTEQAIKNNNDIATELTLDTSSDLKDDVKIKDMMPAAVAFTESSAKVDYDATDNNDTCKGQAETPIKSTEEPANRDRDAIVTALAGIIEALDKSKAQTKTESKAPKEQEQAPSPTATTKAEKPEKDELERAESPVTTKTKPKKEVKIELPPKYSEAEEEEDEDEISEEIVRPPTPPSQRKVKPKQIDRASKQNDTTPSSPSPRPSDKVSVVGYEESIALESGERWTDRTPTPTFFLPSSSPVPHRPPTPPEDIPSIFLEGPIPASANQLIVSDPHVEIERSGSNLDVDYEDEDYEQVILSGKVTLSVVSGDGYLPDETEAPSLSDYAQANIASGRSKPTDDLGDKEDDTHYTTATDADGEDTNADISAMDCLEDGKLHELPRDEE